MTTNNTILSQTLGSLTITKIEELEKQRRNYEDQKRRILQAADDELDPISSLRILSDKVPQLLNGTTVSVPKNDNMPLLLHQATHDPSLSTAALQEHDSSLRTLLDQQSRRLEIAVLYSKLVMEWLNPPEKTIGPELSQSVPVDVDGGDNLVVVERNRLQHLRNKFKNVVFSPLETDEDAINSHLEGLFDSDNGRKTLAEIRREVEAGANGMLKKTRPFSISSVTKVMDSMLSESELLNDAKKTMIESFKRDERVLQEIVDVLNMRFADIENWTWDAAEGIAVQPRKQLNGKYRIMMDEDVLQAVFVQHIGLDWCDEFNESVTREIAYSSFFEGLFAGDGKPNRGDEEERAYFLDRRTLKSVGDIRIDQYKQELFMDQFHTGAYDDGGDSDRSTTDKKTGTQRSQELLRLLATELTVRGTIQKEAAIIQTDMQWFGTSLPHSTIYAVLRFLGVPEAWMKFFKTFLEAPLRLTDDQADAEGVRIRKRGAPMAHALERCFGEMVLFCLDMSVLKEAGIPLYRMHDDLWLVGSPKQCAQAWQTLERVAGIMGLEFNQKKTGSAYLSFDKPRDEAVVGALPKGAVSMGFLKLNPESGKWEINQDLVDAHVKQLKTQLNNCTSVLAWVQTWNSCLGRFFTHNFGQPAHCFGLSHTVSILETLTNMQKELFPSNDANNGAGSLPTYLKSVLNKRFGVSNVPDAFLFMPEEFGGLGTCNPFIPNLLVIDNLKNSPELMMENFFEHQGKNYMADFERFQKLGKNQRLKRLEKCSDEPQFDPHTFFSFEKYIEHCMWDNDNLAVRYEYLQKQPHPVEVKLSNPSNWVQRECSSLTKGAGRDKKAKEHEIRWILQQSESELREQCGDLTLTDKRLLPLGVLEALKKRRVAWQMVL